MADKNKRGELKKLEEAVKAVYLIADPYITKFICAMILTQKLSSDPAWAVIVAPPGGGKSEFINMIGKCMNVHALSTLTSRTLVSGAKKAGEETSLLMKIGKTGIITFKDMTSLLSENKDDRSVIMGQLREIFDGKYDKTFGTGETVSWAGKITVIAGATYAIHTLRQAYTAMGERFLFYNLIQPDRIEAARRNMENQQEGNMAEKRNNLSDMMKQYVDVTVEIPEKLPDLDEDLKNKILDIAELATRARSETERNWRSPQMEITEVHPPEMPTRFAGAVMAIALALAVINHNEYGKFDLLEGDKKILYKIALDSVTKSKRIAMQELAKYDVLETGGLATKIGFPTSTIRRWMEDLTALGVAEREKHGGSKGDRWKILPRYKTIISEFEDIKIEGGELTDDNADAGDLPTDEKKQIEDENKAAAQRRLDEAGF